MTTQTKASLAYSDVSSTQTAVKQAAQRIITLLEQGRMKTSLSRSQFFAHVLQVWNAELYQTDLDEFLNVACIGVEKAMNEIAAAFEVLFTQAMHNYCDILGATFMLAGLAWKTVGDEYTPWDLVQLLVRLQMGDFKPPKPDDPPISIYDPCCGSGAFLLGFLDYIDTYYPEVLDRDQVNVYGQELTSVGWMMCRINLRIHQITRGFRRSRVDTTQIEAQANMQIKASVQSQETATSSGLIQQHLWFPADVRGDTKLRQKPGNSSHAQKRRKPETFEEQAPYSLAPLFDQPPLPLSVKKEELSP